MESFSFAGFTFPRRVGMLPRGSMAQRIDRMRKPITGGYFTAPKPGTRGACFYLESDFMPGLRWQWCDETPARIDHAGWFCDESQDQKIRGIVMRLTNDRGFVAGWSMGEGMASYIETDYIYGDEISAAYAADSIAESAAESEREYQRDEQLRVDIEEQMHTAHTARATHSRLARTLAGIGYEYGTMVRDAILREMVDMRAKYRDACETIKALGG